ncbi:hypothetical protein SEA_KOKO_78 [Mycobacterium phage Koko]|uniref:Uncharacterized protein n=2 Tax=Gladiatorvirus TaxID=2948726 RepID=A0A1C9LYX9_9CAUD|nr:hypothetical protein KIP56_gp036 [Mycobacterium phage Koko]ANT42264.1 hypothetical protein SEA_TONETONE_74 [Mycobacterium phage ToneTone]AOQ28090.1 hypothetical protein SEA_GRUUNAGA_76 [Mycobacterium phage Gruunaga]ASZ74547.1 hypothetical protein SEA_WIKS_76 [Mycobacterium phage Wiks]AYD84891.1 hypothetical protein SEA_ZULU_78 [Mycobacterium phage Zulu]QAY14242.1 hypothetical protein SEA_HEXAMO_76 [Mycobacterium phage Hexamo]QYC54114.1 hypothetical protein SEA_ROKSOLANA_77 [Mycobacterium p
MPLNTLGKLFPGFDCAKQEVLVDEPAWLYAWRMEGWRRDLPSIRATYLLVYRSPLVKCTDHEYQPIRDVMLGPDRMDVLGEGTLEDPNMMFGEGEYILHRLAPVGFKSMYTTNEIRSIIAEVLAGASA